MLHDCNYNKVRLLHDLSRITNFIKKHAKKDVKKSHLDCHKLYLQLEKDLEKHVQNLSEAISTQVKAGKFK